VLYLENSTDLTILQTFARTLDHEAKDHLERPFVKYVETNLPQKARDHFFGSQEAKSDLVAVAVFDRLEKELQSAQRPQRNHVAAQGDRELFLHGERPARLRQA